MNNLYRVCAVVKDFVELVLGHLIHSFIKQVYIEHLCYVKNFSRHEGEAVKKQMVIPEFMEFIF